MDSTTNGFRNILVIRHADPGNTVYGGIAYTNSVLTLLKMAFPDVVVDQLFVYESLDKLKSRSRKALSTLRSLFTRYPAKIEHFQNPTFAKTVRNKLSACQYDFVILNGIDVVPYSNILDKQQPTIYIAHNWEYKLYRQQIAPYSTIPLIGHLLKYDLRKLEAFEIDALMKVGGVIFISSEDANAVCHHIHEGCRTIIGPIFSYPADCRESNERQRPSSKIRLGFLGNLQWWPNREAVDWFLDKVFNKLSVKKFELHLFGQNSKTYSHVGGVIAHGFVENIQDVWRSVDCMVQPIQSGAGINIKVAETLYNRVPMVATSTALRGLPIAPDSAIVSLDGADAWVAFFLGNGPQELIRNRVLESNARQFGIDRKVSQLKKFIRTVLAKSPRSVTGAR